MRICLGLPRHRMIISKTRMTRSAGKEVSTSIHKASRLKSSKTFKVRKALPLVKLSLMKSSDQLSLAWVGWVSTWVALAGSRFLGFRFKFRARPQYTR